MYAHTNQSEKNILSLLYLSCQGRENAMTSREITGMTGVGQKQVQKIIRDFRRFGHPIGADFEVGYWWIVDPEEHKTWIEQLRRRAFDYLRTVSIQGNITAAKLAGQLKLELEG